MSRRPPKFNFTDNNPVLDTNRSSTAAVPAANNSPAINLPSEIKTIYLGNQIQLSRKNITKEFELGNGYYGFVEAYRHRETNSLFAVKRIVINSNANQSDQERLLNDLNVSVRSTNCEFVIHSYGALMTEGEIWIFMDLMDTSLDKLYKAVYSAKERITERVLLYITKCVVTALEYLHSEIHVIHRDVKPSNILASCHGHVKVCDFGISGNLVNSVAKTNVGTEDYLAPERISDGSSPYDIRADVWSLGLSLFELSIGRFPIPQLKSVFHRLKYVVEGQAPRLGPESGYSAEFRQLLSDLLEKDKTRRITYDRILALEIIVAVDIAAELPMMGDYVSRFTTCMTRPNCVPPVATVPVEGALAGAEGVATPFVQTRGDGDFTTPPVARSNKNSRE